SIRGSRPGMPVATLCDFMERLRAGIILCLAAFRTCETRMENLVGAGGRDGGRTSLDGSAGLNRREELLGRERGRHARDLFHDLVFFRACFRLGVALAQLLQALAPDAARVQLVPSYLTTHPPPPGYNSFAASASLKPSIFFWPLAMTGRLKRLGSFRIILMASSREGGFCFMLRSR